LPKMIRGQSRQIGDASPKIWLPSMDSFPTGRRARTIDGAVRVFQDRDLNSAMKSEVPQGVVLHLGVASEVGGREWVEATLPDGTSGYVLGANVRSHTTTADSGGDDDSMLEWSVQPGFHERRLLLRHNNLFFPPERRSVSKHELSSAKQMDAEMFKRFEESAQLTIALFLQQREHYEIREAAKLQREVEETVNLGSGLGLGARDLLRPLKAGCDALAAQVETAMIAGSPNDESAIRRHANLLRTLYDFERHQAYIDVSRAEPTDRLPTLLSCSAEDLRFLFQELPPELADVSKAWQTSKEELRTFAIQLMHESPEAKSKLLQERGKLALLGISIPLSPRFREASSRVRSHCASSLW